MGHVAEIKLMMMMMMMIVEMRQCLDTVFALSSPNLIVKRRIFRL